MLGNFLYAIGADARSKFTADFTSNGIWYWHVKMESMREELEGGPKELKL